MAVAWSSRPTLGVRLGVASQALYVVLGAIGLPFYASAEGGGRRPPGRRPGTSSGSPSPPPRSRRASPSAAGPLAAHLAAGVAFGSAVIYVCGAAWLAHSLDVSAERAIELGVTPFLIGDALKIAIVGVGLPVAWRLAGDRR